MIERPFQDAIGSLKMIAGTDYMIRADILREVGWGTSLTDDWELTLKLYARGYKVVYTPWAETPAECVATFSRLARQRMRWAEGHSHNVRKWFVPIMLSPFLAPIEKVEFLYDSTYYLQAALLVVGSLSWLVSEVVFHVHAPRAPRAPRPRRAQSGPQSASARAVRHNRKLGWVTVGALILALGVLGWGSMHASVVEAAGNPLYLHGTGAAPGCTPGSMSPTAGARSPACSINDAVGVFSFTNLPAQTISAGIWSFTMYWTPAGPTPVSTISLRVGVAPGPSCVGFVATIPNAGTTWTTTFGAGGVQTTSPFTLSTSASQLSLAIPAGGSPCLSAD